MMVFCVCKGPVPFPFDFFETSQNALLLLALDSFYTLRQRDFSTDMHLEFLVLGLNVVLMDEDHGRFVSCKGLGNIGDCHFSEATATATTFVALLERLAMVGQHAPLT